MENFNRIARNYKQMFLQAFKGNDLKVLKIYITI